MKDQIKVETVWNRYGNGENLPKKHCLCLVITGTEDVTLADFFCKGDIVKESSPRDGVFHAIVANEDGFYVPWNGDGWKILTFIDAWTVIPENASCIMDQFVEK